MARRGGRNSLFTYDFGVAIAQGTVLRIGKMTTAVTALAGAMYFLNRSATQYVKTIRENTMQFGSIFNAMQKMQDAQTRIIKGQTAFSVDDQMKGMNMLMSAGLEVEKNFEFINKAAHAMGQSFAGFSGAITAGINGDMSALVQMGVLTQRAAKRFDIYHAGTVQRQQAVMEFLLKNQGIQNAINNDFTTINDKITQLTGTFKQFILDVVGDPKNPNSLYAKAVEGIGWIADAFKRNIGMIRQWGERLGEVLGWSIKTMGKFIVYLGRQFNRFFGFAQKSAKTFAEGTKSLVVSLEFMKLRVKAVFDGIFDFMDRWRSELKWLGVILAGVFGLNMVTKFAGAMMAVIASINPWLLALVATLGIVVATMDKVKKDKEEGKRTAHAATTAAFEAKTPKDVMSASVTTPLGGGGLSAEDMAIMALQMEAKRKYGYTIPYGDVEKEAAKMFKTKRGAFGIKRWDTIAAAEEFLRQKEEFEKTGKNLGYFITSKGKPELTFGEFGDGITPIFGEGVKKEDRFKGMDEGAIKIYNAIKGETESVDETISNLESMGATEESIDKTLKKIEGYARELAGATGNVSGNTYLQKGAVTVNAKDADAKEVAEKVMSELESSARMRKMLKPNPLYETTEGPKANNIHGGRG